MYALAEVAVLVFMAILMGGVALMTVATSVVVMQAVRAASRGLRARLVSRRSEEAGEVVVVADAV
jgi:hypothetical protein